MKKCLIKILTVTLSLLVLASCLLISPVAATPDFSPGFGSVAHPAFSGLVDYIVSFESTTGNYASVILNPVISSSMDDSDDFFTGMTGGSDYHDDHFDISTTYYDFLVEPPGSSDVLDSGTLLGSSFNVAGFSLNLTQRIKIEARDFYWLLNPNDVEMPYDAIPCQGYLEIRNDSSYGFSDISMDYYVAGNYDDLLSYSTPVSALDDNWFSLSLPTDQSLGGLYDEPTLIYVEYVCLSIQLNDYPDPANVRGHYYSYNGDFRNQDLDSVPDEIDVPTPMDPGIFADYTSWIGTALGGFLDLQIVSGFTLGGILMTIIGFLLAIWFLKLIAGG